MLSSSHIGHLFVASLLVLSAASASAQSFRVQCPTTTPLHPTPTTAPNPVGG